MKRQVFVSAGVAAALVWAAHTNVQAQAGSQDAKGGKTTTVTGCLAKGSDATTFVLNDASPAGEGAGAESKGASKATARTSYQVMAKESSLKLADHVGHTVTLTGTVAGMGAGAGAGASKSGAGGSAAGAGTGAGGSTAGSGTGASGSTAGSGAGSGSSSGSAAGASGAGKSGGMPHLMVTAMKHVSATCTR